ncbi:peptide transporter family 1-like isoform X1 [Microplitis mediator]|uniref:peptide transporter family 1-like isoform X1 n=1 Tax=Microplitis mediator TaxID=375433 RepID=UPI002556EFA1|nr:peptide transporter family 1-like isoform X1 [Microplitis mediator]
MQRVTEELDSEESIGTENDSNEKLKYPKSVFFIVSNEFCERFSYYGMRTILSLYLSSKLEYSDDTATVIYHTFTMFVYFFPLIGAIIADSLLGKFRTILYLSIVYAIGQLLLSASAAPTFGLPIREFSILGLLLIALGSGGIKPCVAAFGGDQFILPQQEKYLGMFFSVFYFAINLGSLISTFATPELRHGVKCFGDQTCYSVAFLVPAILMISSIVIFVLGKPMYRMKKPEGNVILNVTKCIYHAIHKKMNERKITRDHWLDHADDKYDAKLISDIKSTLKVLKLFIPLPFFWALYDQQGSRWTFQATRMDGQIGSFVLKADQMQVVNPLFIVIFIPIFETCIYPLMAKIKFINTPLKKMVTGGFLAGLAFIVSGIVELQLEKTYPVLPSSGLAQLRLFNPNNCDIGIKLNNNQSFDISPFAMWQDTNINTIGDKSIEYEANFSKCGFEKLNRGLLNLTEKKAMSYALIPDSSPYEYQDHVNKTEIGNPAVRVLTYNTLDTPAIVQIINSKDKILYKSVVTGKVEHSLFVPLDTGNYRVEVNGVSNEIVLHMGGVYTVQAYASKELTTAKIVTVTQPNSMHILWLIPQYVIITIGEVMLAITGFEFAFTQAPISMKSLVQAGWLFTAALGNFIVVIVTEAKIFDRQANEFFLFAGLMIVDMMIFSVMAKFYRYIVVNDSDDKITDKSNGTTLKDYGENNLSFTKNDE